MSPLPPPLPTLSLRPWLSDPETRIACLFARCRCGAPAAAAAAATAAAAAAAAGAAVYSQFDYYKLTIIN